MNAGFEYVPWSSLASSTGLLKGKGVLSYGFPFAAWNSAHK